ncbi:MAG: chromosome partitioning protein ParB [Stutzerimonas stutzeri]|nr:MAG: chromosome partitioning protein ParB [Stutzerimonas stutzeri]
MRAIEYLTVPVGELRKNPWNTNKVSAADELKIRKSLQRNGMFKPIIVRQVKGEGGYEILGGEHRWEQAIELGVTEVPVANLGEISDKQAKEIGVIDNARYGTDDTLSFSELLKEIGNIDELQEFLPYGSEDLDAIFSASVIALDELELENTLGDAEEEPDEEEVPTAKPAKTHAVMRFRIANADAERLTALVSKTQKDQGFIAEDQLTNAGDALIFLLTDLLRSVGTPAYKAGHDIDAILDDALANPESE